MLRPFSLVLLDSYRPAGYCPAAPGSSFGHYTHVLDLSLADTNRAYLHDAPMSAYLAAYTVRQVLIVALGMTLGHYLRLPLLTCLRAFAFAFLLPHPGYVMVLAS